MTIAANSCGSGVAVGVTIAAVNTGVRTGKREIGRVMVETGRCITCRMTGKTSWAVVRISSYSIVLIIHICLVVLMAIDTTELGIVGCVCMTISAGGPFTVVLA